MHTLATVHAYIHVHVTVDSTFNTHAPLVHLYTKTRILLLKSKVLTSCGFPSLFSTPAMCRSTCCLDSPMLSLQAVAARIDSNSLVVTWGKKYTESRAVCYEQLLCGICHAVGVGAEKRQNLSKGALAAVEQGSP